MKMKTLLGLVAALFLFSGTAFAFHGGGVAHCDGCHSMHNSADNARAGSATSADLMKGSDASSTCLNCHAGDGGYDVASTAGGDMSQGGDFFWVTSAATHDWTTRGTLYTADTDQKGHNIIAADFGMAVDANNATAPGGTMAANTLGCTSCHDPHGQVNGGTSAGTAAISVSGSYGAADPVDGSIHGNYRLLGDTGYKLITAAAPVARAEGSRGNLVDYGTGMSSWCLSCHPSFNDNSNMHPTNVAVPAVYDQYVASGNFTGTVATGKDSLVPFERNLADGSLLDETSTVGVDSSGAQVMCLSCHRAHASAFDNALRWDDGQEFLVDSVILNETSTTLMANGAIPYFKDGVAVDIATDYGQYQRSLCNKCHAKD